MSTSSGQSIHELLSTPRRRKNPPKTQAHILPPPPRAPDENPPWPRLGGQSVPDSKLIEATEHIFGYPPRPYQLRAAKKILEGHDIFFIAATGAGKSLVFAIVAIAARLLGLKRLVIVICPLKALQMDQVSVSLYIVR